MKHTTMPARRMRRIIMEFGVYLLLIITLGSTLLSQSIVFGYALIEKDHMMISYIIRNFRVGLIYLYINSVPYTFPSIYL